MIELYLKKQGIKFPSCLKKRWWAKKIDIEAVLKVCGIVPLKMIQKNDIVVFTEEDYKTIGYITVVIDPGHFLDNCNKIHKFNKYWMSRYKMAIRIGGF